ADGNNLTGTVTVDGENIDVSKRFAPISDDVYYIVTSKCTECVGFHEEPQCAAVCPVDCCVADPDNEETKDVLLEKKQRMHA
ncbi:MAG: ferredoxin, partial [Bacteroidetes bacterium]|nr:ferredoxin [Bacteroidota bacterium]